MTYKMGTNITGKFYIKGSGTCSGNGTITIRATSKRNPSVYTDYEVKISNQGSDCNPATSINYIGSENEQWFYPNPATSRVIVNNPFRGKAIVYIYDLNGRRLIEKQGDKSIILEVNSLDSGVYIVKLNVNGEMLFDKLIISR
jgi:hypothetical protein